MTSAGYIVASFAASFALGALVFFTRRRQVDITRWRLALLAFAALALGFQLVGLVGDLALGDQAMPAWSGATVHLWMLAFAAIYFADPAEERRHYTPWLGLMFLVIGGLAIADDVHHFIART